MPHLSDHKTMTLVISGGIAAYKSLELIRLIKKRGWNVRCILTAGGEKFVTPLSVAALSGEAVYTDLWSLKDQREMGHIRLSRESDLIVIAPASANIIAQMAHGMAADLATTMLLASDKPVMIAPAMNHKMWDHPAVQDNLAILEKRCVLLIPPEAGDMACGEYGMGRMAEPDTIMTAIEDFFGAAKPLQGLKALVTSGPTFEPLDPVRFIGNRSSGRQGHAIAEILAARGAAVTLVSGVVHLPDPRGVKTVSVETAAEMLRACEESLPADIAICAAAVGDFGPVELSAHKIKKRENGAPPVLTLKENPDILHTLSHHPRRPRLLIGFAAETQNIETHAREKLARKGCDWIMGNLVDGGAVFGAEDTHLHRFTASGGEDWGSLTKHAAAARLADEIEHYFAEHDPS